MAFYTSTAVDGPNGINSLTQDPPKPTEAGVASIIKGSNAATKVGPQGIPLRIIQPGSGYSAGQGRATTTTTAALNDWSGQSVHDPALTTVTVDIEVDSQGAIVDAFVRTAANINVGYLSGDWIEVTGGGGNGGILEISSN